MLFIYLYIYIYFFFFFWGGGVGGHGARASLEGFLCTGLGGVALKALRVCLLKVSLSLSLYFALSFFCFRGKRRFERVEGSYVLGGLIRGLLLLGWRTWFCFDSFCVCVSVLARE